MIENAKFQAVAEPTPDTLAAIAALSPTNPYFTANYMAARRVLGAQPWLLLTMAEDKVTAGCPAFMRIGRVNKSLEIHSLPELPSPQTFWDGLLAFCREQGISDVEVNSYASESAKIPTLPGETKRKARIEYIIDLQVPDLFGAFSKGYRYIVRKVPEGLTVEQRSGEASLVAHARLIGASMERRKNRGEIVPEENDMANVIAMLDAGAGSLFQSVLNGEVFSSALVVLAEQGGYYNSAGTSPEGMKCGASHFLISEIARTLQGRSMKTFNLGGTGLGPENEGLRQFKSRFGARSIELESVAFSLGSSLKKKVFTALRTIHNATKRS